METIWGNLLEGLLSLTLAWAGADDYEARQRGKLALWGLSQAGWRKPVDLALADRDPDVRRLGLEVSDALEQVVNPARGYPKVEDLVPPADLAELHAYWVGQANLREEGYWTESSDVSWDSRTREVALMRREMCRRFAQEAVQGGYPPFLLSLKMAATPIAPVPEPTPDIEDPECPND